MQSVLDLAIEELRRKLFLEEANRAYSALLHDAKLWRREEEERSAWERTSLDGLKDE